MESSKGLAWTDLIPVAGFRIRDVSEIIEESGKTLPDVNGFKFLLRSKHFLY